MMNKVRLPGLLDASLSETARLRPASGSLTLNMVGSGEASLILPEDGPAVHIHDWVSMYTQNGFAGIFRVSNVSQTFRRQTEITLLHGIDILSDSVWPAQFEFSGTKAQFLTQLLNQQTHLVNGVKPWVLGTCADNTSYERQINYDRLSNLFEDLVQDGGNYYFVYDQTSFPWTVSCVAKPQGVSGEFRLSRNVRSASVTYNDADLCTRLHLSVSSKHDKTSGGKTQTVYGSAVKTYDNTAAQAIWGVVVKTADIDTHDDIQEQHFESADAWAQHFLSLRAEPSVQIQIDGDELSRLTGDSWDELSIGKSVRVALPDYGHTFTERAVSVTYPDLFKDPSHVTVSLANTLPRFSESIANAQAAASATARSARASARTLEETESIVIYHDGQITSIDGTVSQITGSTIWTQRETLGAIVGTLTMDQQGNLVVKDGKGMYVRRDGVDYGIWDNGNLTAGVIVSKINGSSDQTETTILSSKIKLNGDTTLAGKLSVNDSGLTTISGSVGIGNINSGIVSINGGKVTAANIDLNIGGELTFVTGQSSYVKLTGAVLTDMVTDVQISGPVNNVYTLQKKTVGNSSWQNCNVTFSRAATLSGGWGSGSSAGIFSVDASPQDQHYKIKFNGTSGTADATLDAVVSASGVTPILSGTYLQFTLNIGTYTEGADMVTRAALTRSVPCSSVTGLAATNPLTVASQTDAQWADLSGVTEITSQITSGGKYLITASPKYGAAAQLKFIAPSGGTQRTAFGLSDTIVLPSSHTSTATITGNTVLYDDDTESTNFPVSIDATLVYQAGQAAAQAGDVDVVKGTWSSGSIDFTPASGNGNGVTLTISAAHYTPTESDFNGFLRVTGYDIRALTRINDGSTNTGVSVTNWIQYDSVKGYVFVTSNQNTPQYGVNILARKAFSGGITAQRSVSSLSQVVLSADHTSATEYTTTVTYDNNTTGNAVITVDASAIIGSPPEITDIYGDRIESYETLTTVPIKANGTSLSEYSENATLAKTTYTSGGNSLHCVTLSMNSTVIGRISTEDVYQQGRSDGAGQTVYGTITDITGSAIATNQQVTSIPLTASGTNVSAPYTENATLALDTYQVGSITRDCVTLSIDSKVIGRIATGYTKATVTLVSGSPTSITRANTANAFYVHKIGWNYLYYYDSQRETYVPAASDNKSHYWYYSASDMNSDTYATVGSTSNYYPLSSVVEDSDTYYTKDS